MTDRLITAAPAWILAAVMLASAVWAITHSLRAGRIPRRDLRRLEQYANCPHTRPILDDFHKPRKEKPQP